MARQCHRWSIRCSSAPPAAWAAFAFGVRCCQLPVSPRTQAAVWRGVAGAGTGAAAAPPCDRGRRCCCRSSFCPRLRALESALALELPRSADCARVCDVDANIGVVGAVAAGTCGGGSIAGGPSSGRGARAASPSSVSSLDRPESMITVWLSGLFSLVGTALGCSLGYGRHPCRADLAAVCQAHATTVRATLGSAPQPFVPL